MCSLAGALHRISCYAGQTACAFFSCLTQSMSSFELSAEHTPGSMACSSEAVFLNAAVRKLAGYEAEAQWETGHKQRQLSCSLAKLLLNRRMHEVSICTTGPNWTWHSRAPNLMNSPEERECRSVPFSATCLAFLRKKVCAAINNQLRLCSSLESARAA